MEKNCIFCETPIYPDIISYKIGEHFICYRCASTQTIRNLNNVLNDELRVDPNLVDVTDFSLAGQTDSSDFPLPNGCNKNCPYYPYDTCGHYYGEGHMCMLGEEASDSITCADYIHDATAMSEDDYLSKYVTDNDALSYWVAIHPDSIE